MLSENVDARRTVTFGHVPDVVPDATGRCAGRSIHGKARWKYNRRWSTAEHSRNRRRLATTTGDGRTNELAGSSSMPRKSSMPRTYRVLLQATIKT